MTFMMKRKATQIRRQSGRDERERGKQCGERLRTCQQEREWREKSNFSCCCCCFSCFSKLFSSPKFFIWLHSTLIVCLSQRKKLKCSLKLNFYQLKARYSKALIHSSRAAEKHKKVPMEPSACIVGVLWFRSDAAVCARESSREIEKSTRKKSHKSEAIIYLSTWTSGMEQNTLSNQLGREKVDCLKPAQLNSTWLVSLHSFHHLIWFWRVCELSQFRCWNNRR